MNILTTSLLGVRANALGGIHLHKLFGLPCNDKLQLSPFKSAAKALEKIRRKINLLHILLTMDVLFIDELGQKSAQQIATIDIIMRKLRNSQLPFGGILIIGSMDNSQIQPIDQLPFLTSSMVLTCFQAIKLQHSVRAYGDIDFQRLQELTRKCPYELRQSIEYKNEFFELAGRILTFVPDWKDNRISPNMMRAFSRIRPAQNALNEYRENIKQLLDTESIVFRVAYSRDLQRTRSTNAEYSDATENSIKALNKELKEPSQIVFFAGGFYECTINDSRGRYNQSQLAFMAKLPEQHLIDRFDAIPLWIAPPGTQAFEYNQHNIPTEHELKEKGWNEVSIGVSPEKIVSARGGIHTKRLQYSLKHIGAITINKSQGETLPLGIAIEITQQYSLWEKGQVVVALSRTTNSQMTVIVGEKTYAIEKIWELITIANQWTLYTAKVLSMISLNSNSIQEPTNFNFPDSYPFF